MWQTGILPNVIRAKSRGILLKKMRIAEFFLCPLDQHKRFSTEKSNQQVFLIIGLLGPGRAGPNRAEPGRTGFADGGRDYRGWGVEPKPKLRDSFFSSYFPYPMFLLQSNDEIILEPGHPSNLDVIQGPRCQAPRRRFFTPLPSLSSLCLRK